MNDINAQDLINQLVNEYSQDMAAKNQQIALLKRQIVKFKLNI